MQSGQSWDSSGQKALFFNVVSSAGDLSDLRKRELLGHLNGVRHAGCAAARGSW